MTDISEVVPAAAPEDVVAPKPEGKKTAPKRVKSATPTKCHLSLCSSPGAHRIVLFNNLNTSMVCDDHHKCAGYSGYACTRNSSHLFRDKALCMNCLIIYLSTLHSAHYNHVVVKGMPPPHNLDMIDTQPISTNRQAAPVPRKKSEGKKKEKESEEAGAATPTADDSTAPPAGDPFDGDGTEAAAAEPVAAAAPAPKPATKPSAAAPRVPAKAGGKAAPAGKSSNPTKESLGRTAIGTS